ncbi:Activin receptor type-1, variant 2 [Clonorchis sinensis]|uniref:receptor protein serine/threonine kinase n=1 Tax=Clonorchis sinensis TaxID=79923 RepID=A0A8T1MQJ7_CLOSI|nr:Activin receptor type-1, variant 2 [Clonorchis sinensis]
MTAERSLRCVCSPPEHCDVNQNGICITNVGCYHSAVIGGQHATESFGCFQNDSMHLLFSCKITQNPKIRIRCCTKRDFCNRHLLLDRLAKNAISGERDSLSNTSNSGVQVLFADGWKSLVTEMESSHLKEDQMITWNNAQRHGSYLGARPDSKHMMLFRIGPLWLAAFLIVVFVVCALLLWIFSKRGSRSTDKTDKTCHVFTSPNLPSINNQCVVRSYPTGLLKSHRIKRFSSGNPMLKVERCYSVNHKIFDSKSPKANPEVHSDMLSYCEAQQGNSKNKKILQTATAMTGERKKEDRMSLCFAKRMQKSPRLLAVWLPCTHAPKQSENFHQTFFAQVKGTTIPGNICHQPPCLVSGSSGSGSGVPFLVQRTIARQIELKDCIGCGRFGEVWHGLYEGEDVAVKIFSSRDEQSWLRETTIFTRLNLRHENLLSYLASDLTSRNGCTQLWMITQYHSAGSLYDYLQRNTFPVSVGLLLAASSAKGLCYLHSVIAGVHGKPAIAHRDIKSKNILVQANGTCCIADLGLAEVHHGSNETSFFACPNYKVGTKRYMAPETLSILCTTYAAFEGYSISSGMSENETLMDTHVCPPRLSFETLKAADVYAFSLVLWEVLRRCTLQDSDDADPYMLPYGDLVDSDPTFQTMYQIVCVDALRPPFSSRWVNDKVTGSDLYIY